MNKRVMAAVLWPLGVLSLVAGVAAVGRTAPEPERPSVR